MPSHTLRSRIRGEIGPVGDGEGWRFCESAHCPVVYFRPGGRTILKDALKVRVGIKENGPPRPLCYCFGHSVESIREEIARTGRSSVVQAISARVKAGECQCEVLNPRGSCCLGDVNRAVQEAFAELGSAGGARTGPSGARASFLAAGGAVLAALASSACCWLPLLLVAAGASAAGVSAAFESVRPAFLVLAPLALGAGFYFAYFRKEKCAPGEACAVRRGSAGRWNRVLLWAAAAAVLAFALFPSYAPALLRHGGSVASPLDEEQGAGQTVALRIEGMTCAACAARLESQLAKAAGVRAASVRYPEGQAEVALEPGAPADLSALLRIVEQAGFQAEAVSPP